MKIAYSWLKEYLDIKLPPEEVANLLTNCGLEVEGIEKLEAIPGGLEGLVIGEVLSCEKHPNADKLKITSVDVGIAKSLSIVCGAPNVAKGQKVIIALVGTTIYPNEGDPFKIKKAKIRGEVSEGMICAQDEVGIGTDHDGIVLLPSTAIVGEPVKSHYGISEDMVFEIGLTPNRIDAASHIGVARDLFAVLNFQKRKVKLKLPSIGIFKPTWLGFSIKVEISASNACARYAGITLTGVRIGESPKWLKSRLKSIGLNPVNNVVDITNFVLHETGQPLHAFDADKIEGGKVTVKTLKQGTRFTTLDGEERNLSADDLMICNEKEGMCIAGVLGGLNSGITAETKNIFLESACFAPVSVRKTSKRHNIHTDASYRFERGTDVDNVIYALKRAAMLIQEIGGVDTTSDIIDVYPKQASRNKIAISFNKIQRISGADLSPQTIIKILELLDFEIVKKDRNGLVILVPFAKVDVMIAEDIVEEIIRVYGYNNIETNSKISFGPDYGYPRVFDEKQQRILTYLADNGFNEVITNSIVGANRVEESEAHILNPLSGDLKVMRTEILENVLEVISYNFNRKNKDLKLYELGRIYNKANTGIGYTEETQLNLFATGDLYPSAWQGVFRKMDFYFIKSVIEGVIEKQGWAGLDLSEDNNELGKIISYQINGKVLATCIDLRKELLLKYEIDQPVYMGQICLDNLLNSVGRGQVKYEKIGQFPEVNRDVALLLDQHIAYEEVKQVALNTEKKILTNVRLFDVYQGKQISSSKKSYAVSLTFQDRHKTLRDEEVDRCMNKLIKAFQEKLKAEIR